MIFPFPSRKGREHETCQPVHRADSRFARSDCIRGSTALKEIHPGFGTDLAGSGPKRPVPKGGNRMKPAQTLALVLIVAGVLALLYGGFTYTKTSHDTKIGPLEFSVKNKETVNIPVWAGIGAIVVGGVLLFLRPKP